jgi:enterochelin esterase-like enzyme
MNIRGVIFTVAVVFLLAACAPATTSTSVSEKQNLTEAERLLERRNQEGSSVWADGNTLTFVYEGEAESVDLCCGFQEPLTRLPGSKVWVLSKQISNISEAIIGYNFSIDGKFPETWDRVWRGADAPPEPERLEPTIGRVFERTINSEILSEDRKVYVYLPPDYDALKLLGDLPVVYLADGGVVMGYASVVEPLIREGKLPQLILIGIESGYYTGDPNAEYEPLLDMRYREYIPSEGDDRFALHERFVIDEVLPWAEETFGASDEREKRIVYGHSNGGVFAAAMGLKNSDVFGYALPFSVGVDPSDQIDADTTTKFYFASGELEESFFSTTKNLAQRLSDEGVISTFSGRVAGHDILMWEEEFIKGLTWVFGE